MSDTPNPNLVDDVAQVAPLRLLAQYIKDLSFELPSGPEIFGLLRSAAPEIPTSLDMAMRHMSDSTYEVTLSAHIEAFVSSKTAFILELEYGCVVEIDEKQIPPDHIHPALLMEVPRLMFPFVRQIVADMTVSGGFPPLMLQMVDFRDIYHKKFGVGGEVQKSGEAAPPEGSTIN
jgi:preprotein translocase subunit SecB